MRFGLAAGFCVALSVGVRPAAATTIKVFSYEEIQDFASASTDIVRASFVRWERRADRTAGRGPDGSFSVPEMYANQALARLRVSEVLSGSESLANREIVVIDSSLNGMERWAQTSAVLFLRRDGERFWPVRHAVFTVSGTDVNLALPGKMTIPLSELTTMVRKPSRVRVTWTGTVGPTTQAGGVLHVELVAKNEGTTPAVVLPPSYCASVKAYPLESDDRWHARQEHWFEIPTTWFRELNEPMAPLPRGEAHVFRYDVPLASMNMGPPGRYDIVLGMTESFCTVPPASDPKAQRALANYMPDRVLRVAVLGAAEPPAPVQADPSPPAQPDSKPASVRVIGPAGPPPSRGCGGACGVAPQDTGDELAPIGAVLAILAARRRRCTS